MSLMLSMAYEEKGNSHNELILGELVGLGRAQGKLYPGQSLCGRRRIVPARRGRRGAFYGYDLRPAAVVSSGNLERGPEM